MDSSYIPPPFPFPEAWPAIYADQRQQSGRWLTSTMCSQMQWPAAAAGECPTRVADQESADRTLEEGDEGDDGEEGDDGDYEFGYVLSDEWRERFRSSARLTSRLSSTNKKLENKKKNKKKQKQIKQQQEKLNQQTRAGKGRTPPVRSSQASHLQDELDAAKARELARTWKRRSDVDALPGAPGLDPRIKALETSLDLAFDDFCDTWQPVVWPHDPL